MITPSTPEIYATGILLPGDNRKASPTAISGGISAGMWTPIPGVTVDKRKHTIVVIIVAKKVGSSGAFGRRYTHNKSGITQPPRFIAIT